MDLHTFLLTIIACAGFFGILGFVFNLLLSPIKENQARFDGELKEIKSELAELKADIAEIKNLLAAKA